MQTVAMVTVIFNELNQILPFNIHTFSLQCMMLSKKNPANYITKHPGI